MILETPRLWIHMASEDEMRSMIEHEADEELRKAYQEMLQGCLDKPDQWEWSAAWIIERKDGTPVGDLCFKGLNDDGSVEVGYGIEERYWGQGFATEAVEATVDWAFVQPGVGRVEAETDPGNLASQRVLQKCGFVPLGIDGPEGPRFVRVRRS